MLNPNADPAFQHLVRIHHQELLKEIDTNWPCHQPGLLQRINHQVQTAGQWVKPLVWPTMVEPCFDES